MKAFSRIAASVANLAASLLMLQAAHAADAKPLRIGIDPTFKPFTYKLPDGTPTGFDIEIAQALCTEIKRSCSFVESDWDGIIVALNARKFDAIISSMDITEERKRAVDFTNKYYKVPSRLIFPAGQAVSGTNESLKGKRIGVLRGSTEERYAKAEYAPAGAVVVDYATQNDAFLDLKAGRIDGTLVNVVVGQSDFLKTAAGQGFRFVGPERGDEKYWGVGAGIAVRKGDALRAELDRALVAIRADGRYKRIQDKYFDFDVYGR
ncbi:transporter substrate-binding domain-containing protein [Chitinimonas koreensis]|uniref:transporter substrate-binding domain-containing protein n=1 Tax=Chitinimonas koreensis TaxID=356302 RepID=UPI00040ABA99|nr:transporter substrate-binding domain-containing protein [Chitinimonas koreensis]QNM97806.1 transporter substrate-binding domain-containing protein [Chitinimonas koreensis]